MWHVMIFNTFTFLNFSFSFFQTIKCNSCKHRNKIYPGTKNHLLRFARYSLRSLSPKMLLFVDLFVDWLPRTSYNKASWCNRLCTRNKPITLIFRKMVCLLTFLRQRNYERKTVLKPIFATVDLKLNLARWSALRPFPELHNCNVKQHDSQARLSARACSSLMSDWKFNSLTATPQRFHQSSEQPNFDALNS